MERDMSSNKKKISLNKIQPDYMSRPVISSCSIRELLGWFQENVAIFRAKRIWSSLIDELRTPIEVSIKDPFRDSNDTR